MLTPADKIKYNNIFDQIGHTSISILHQYVRRTIESIEISDNHINNHQ